MHWLHRLAAMAVGLPPSIGDAVPVLAPRYAAAAIEAPPADVAADSIEPSTRAQASKPAVRRTMEAPEASSRARRADVSIGAPASAEPNRPDAITEPAAAAPPRPPKQLGTRRPIDGTASRAPSPRAATPAADARTPLLADAPPRRPPSPPPVALSAASLAVAQARATRGADARPVVRVTIDRIDVRAAPPKPEPANRARITAAAPASTSLADYLRRGAP